MSPVSFETSLWPLTSLSFSLALSGAIISPSAGPVARLFVGVVVRRKPQIAGKKQREREKKKCQGSGHGTLISCRHRHGGEKVVSEYNTKKKN